MNPPGYVSNWTVRNVEVDHTGLAKSGSITFRTGWNITIENSTINDVNGDGIWIEKIKGVTLLNNTVTNAHGAAADAVQLNDSSNIVISCNYFDQTGAVMREGVLTLVWPVDAVIEGNTIIGGGFGISAQPGAISPSMITISLAMAATAGLAPSVSATRATRATTIYQATISMTASGAYRSAPLARRPMFVRSFDDRERPANAFSRCRGIEL
ncbi:pectin lyase fold/virulence factor domain-containing protein (plasmid) [Rhizobium etli]|uniref:Pectin lyase fold/virulence factor domain-containing protein n=1 Tax=Rhizobium etli TaxID=29449 RepID=A0AAN1BLK3_RHIET|nr:pectin lyase fold/virulence factor domain-containing protein [Rhizobium etli]